MVYVGQSLETRKWGWQILCNDDGAIRIIEEEYPFSSPGEVFSFMENAQKAFSEGGVRTVRDRETGSYGYTMAVGGTPFKEEFGWSSPEEVNNTLSDLRNALSEGVKMRPDAFAKAKTMRID